VPGQLLRKMTSQFRNDEWDEDVKVCFVKNTYDVFYSGGRQIERNK
jgi:hypothetical protein